MNLTRSTRHAVLAAVVVAFAPFTMTARGEVSFYLQRSGSPEDTGLATFLEILGEYEEQDFEDPNLGELGDEVPSLSFREGTVELELLAQWAEQVPPTIGTSSEFDVEGEIFSRVLVGGIGLTINSVGQRPLYGIGMWIFDDTRAYDAAYHIQVTEPDGSTWEVILENESDQNAYGHEIEGFFGTISNKGITSLTITPIDPDTGEALPDLLEVDHWIVAGLDLIPIDIDLEERSAVGIRGWRHHPQKHPGPHGKKQQYDGRGRKYRHHKNRYGEHNRKYRHHKNRYHNRPDRGRHGHQGDVQREEPRRNRHNDYQREPNKRRGEDTTRRRSVVRRGNRPR